MLRDAFLLHIRRMLAIVRKELLVLFCNPISRMLLIVPPLMQIIVFGWAATMEVRNVDVAVLDHDEGPLSREIVRRLEGSPTFRHVFFLRGQQEVRPAIEQEKALFVMVFDAEFSRRAARGEPVTVQLLLDGRRSNAAQIAAYYVQVMLTEVAAQTPLGRQAALACRCRFSPPTSRRWRAAAAWTSGSAAGSTPISSSSGSSCPTSSAC